MLTVFKTYVMRLSLLNYCHTLAVMFRWFRTYLVYGSFFVTDSLGVRGRFFCRVWSVFLPSDALGEFSGVVLRLVLSSFLEV